MPFSIVNGIILASTKNSVLSGAVSLIATAAGIIYFGQLHGSRGQSVGKIAGKLRVVNLNGSPITLKTAYIRLLTPA